MLRLGSRLRGPVAGLGVRADARLYCGAGMLKKAGATSKGGKSREKVVKLLASTTPDEILGKLKREAEKK
uniref:Chromosome 15 open reading frame 40 n=1 Tax=Oryctolagus cuniculus TaxID=9986 RepID=A0A5F9DCX2_RABIT